MKKYLRVLRSKQVLPSSPAWRYRVPVKLGFFPPPSPLPCSLGKQVFFLQSAHNLKRILAPSPPSHYGTGWNCPSRIRKTPRFPFFPRSERCRSPPSPLRKPCFLCANGPLFLLRLRRFFLFWTGREPPFPFSPPLLLTKDSFFFLKVADLPSLSSRFHGGNGFPSAPCFFFRTERKGRPLSFLFYPLKKSDSVTFLSLK